MGDIECSLQKQDMSGIDSSDSELMAVSCEHGNELWIP